MARENADRAFFIMGFIGGAAIFGMLGAKGCLEARSRAATRLLKHRTAVCERLLGGKMLEDECRKGEPDGSIKILPIPGDALQELEKK